MFQHASELAAMAGRLGRSTDLPGAAAPGAAGPPARPTIRAGLRDRDPAGCRDDGTRSTGTGRRTHRAQDGYKFDHTPDGEIVGVAVDTFSAFNELIRADPPESNAGAHQNHRRNGSWSAGLTRRPLNAFVDGTVITIEQ